MKKKSLTLTLGGAIAASLIAAPVANAAENPFAMKAVDSSMQLAEAGKKTKEGKCGEGKCSAGKMKGGKMKQGACSANKAKEGGCSAAGKMKEGACSANKMKEGGCSGAMPSEPAKP